jgi:hypothetical protein
MTRNKRMSAADVFTATRPICAPHKTIVYRSRHRPIHMTVQIKEFDDRLIIIRRMNLYGKRIRKVEIINTPGDCKSL